MTNDAALLKVSCLFMTAVLCVVIQAHSRIFGDLFCLYWVLNYYSNVEYPPNRPHAKIDFCVRSVLFFRLTTHNFLTARKN